MLMCGSLNILLVKEAVVNNSSFILIAITCVRENFMTFATLLIPTVMEQLYH